MKAIENEIKSIKNDYEEKINPVLRQKIEKYSMIFKELAKVPSPTGQPSLNSKMISTVQEELKFLRREI